MLRWSVLRAALSNRNFSTTGQLGDGREAAAADFVVSHARPGHPADALSRLDEFAYRKSFLVSVGTGVSWDAKDIVHFIGQLLDRDLSIVTDPAKVRASDRTNLQASVRLLETLLPGFRTKSLRESLACTLEAEGFALGHSLVSY